MNTWREAYYALAEDIRAGRFERGEKLPSQSELGRRYSASRHAIRRALKTLADEGFITCWQGREASLVSRTALYQIDHKTRLATGLRAQGHSVEVNIMQTNERKRLPRSVASMFDMPPGSRAPFAEFMHVVDGLPTALGRHYFDGARFPTMMQEANIANPSVPDAFCRHGVSEYFRAATVVEVRSPTASEALALQIPPSQAVLSLLGKNVDHAGAPIEVTEAVVRTDTVKLEIKTHQVGDLV